MSLGEIILSVPVYLLGFTFFVFFMSPGYVPGAVVVWLIRKKIISRNRRLGFLAIAPTAALLLAPSFAAYGHVALVIPIAFCIPFWLFDGQISGIPLWVLVLPSILTFLVFVIAAIILPNQKHSRKNQGGAQAG
jgi:hypothetical protein